MKYRTDKIIIVFFLFNCLASFVNPQTDVKHEYLLNNNEVLSFDKPNKFKMFDKKFYENNLFLVGEHHGTSASIRIQQCLVDEIKAKTNFRHYLIELDYASIVLVNKYLETGDETILQTLFETFRGTNAYSQEYYSVFTHIFQLNQKLKSKDRISFIGVDTVIPNSQSLKIFNEILLNSKYKIGTFPLLDKVFADKQQPFTYSDWRKMFFDLLEDIKINVRRYQKVFGNNFWKIQFLISNFVAFFAEQDKQVNTKPLSEEDTDTIRDTQMAKNFEAQFEHLKLKNEKIFGFFGREHVYQFYGKSQWMTAQIKKNNPNLKIASFSLRYMESDFMIPTYYLTQQFGTKQNKLYFYGGFQNDNSPFVKAVGIDDLNRIEPSANVVLFNLNNVNSPYRTLPDLVEGVSNGKSTTDYFNFAILLRRSKASTPISNDIK